MKKLLILGVALAMSQLTMAQNTISGVVVDEKGNPMPGAKVEVAGNDTESVLTNMDGTFTINSPKSKAKLRSTYVGWNTTTKTGQDGVTIKMSRARWINWKPEKTYWFFGLTGAMPTTNPKSIAPGLMLGCVKNFGFYAKGFTNMFRRESSYHRASSGLNRYWLTDKTKDIYSGVLGGFLVRLKGPIFLNFGAGISAPEHYLQTYDGSDFRCPDCSPEHVVLTDLGLMMKFGKFFVQGGVLGNFVQGSDDTVYLCSSKHKQFVAGNLSFGVIF